MDRPGVYSLTQNDDASDLAIAAAAMMICDVIGDLDGMVAVTLHARFAYGSGGTKVTVYVQTSLDQGATWIDIACLTFTTAAASRVLNLSGLTPRATAANASDGALTDDTAVDGVLGDRLRCKVVSTGTYAGSTSLALRAACR